jgi:uncharacterized protein YneF (UPF0154 family)
MENMSAPETNANTTVIGGGSGKAPRKSRRLMIIIACAAVVVLAVGGYFIYRQIQSNNMNVNVNSETVVDVSSQMDDANEYPKGSYMWANLMLNAAIYAGSNQACKQAQSIINEVKATKLDEGVDVDAAQTTVNEACHA